MIKIIYLSNLEFANSIFNTIFGIIFYNQINKCFVYFYYPHSYRHHLFVLRNVCIINDVFLVFYKQKGVFTRETIVL